jgi:hypothetical protein
VLLRSTRPFTRCLLTALAVCAALSGACAGPIDSDRTQRRLLIERPPGSPALAEFGLGHTLGEVAVPVLEASTPDRVRRAAHAVLGGAEARFEDPDASLEPRAVFAADGTLVGWRFDAEYTAVGRRWVRLADDGTVLERGAELRGQEQDDVLTRMTPEDAAGVERVYFVEGTAAEVRGRGYLLERRVWFRERAAGVELLSWVPERAGGRLSAAEHWVRTPIEGYWSLGPTID